MPYTINAFNIFGNLKPIARSVLVSFNNQHFDEGQEGIKQVREALLESIQYDGSKNEAFLNDIFVINRYIDLLLNYGSLWEKITANQFSSSWDSLQNCLDLLRLIKIFSKINVEFFENQLLKLERLYPYNIFFSIGATVEYFECSICGLDIDSQECIHMRGNLYGGVMANGIARNITELNHVAMVTNPEDKRCVVKYEDSGEQFKLLRFLSSLITSGKLRVSDFGSLLFSKKMRLNPEFIPLGRNAPCFCGSGKKFKKCCISKKYVEGDHVDIVAEPKCIEDAIT